MVKLKGALLQDIAATLCSTETLGGKQLTDLKGGCSSCEDKRRPPIGWGNTWGSSWSGIGSWN